ncbi:MAG TPA: SDR family oxidoreductase [Edaphocola sp.]|nr:SDR family oxidoreductase [Edaphocola sp.]
MILLAGATGYLGQYVLKELLKNGFDTKIIIRNEHKLSGIAGEDKKLAVIKAELTRPQTIKNVCLGVDTVISTVGITRQRDGLSYMDVDFQANMNLLKEAQANGVRKFVYVSVFRGNEFRDIKICAAKEQFVDALKTSGMNYAVVRPNGYFSDMGEFFDMAKKGRIYLFGNGQCHINPIHGADLAKACVAAISSDEKELSLGGPEVYTFNDIARLAFSVLGKKEKIMHIPDWLCKGILGLLRTFSSSKTYGPLEFLMTVLTHEMVAPKYGNHSLKEYFEELNAGGENE